MSCSDRPPLPCDQAGGRRVRACRGQRFSVLQGQLEPQCLQWLQADPYWEVLIDALSDQPASRKMRVSTASVERHHKLGEGCFMGHGPPSISKSGGVENSKPLRARRVFAFARAFKNVNKEWLQDLAQACHRDLSSLPEDMRSP